MALVFATARLLSVRILKGSKGALESEIVGRFS